MAHPLESAASIDSERKIVTRGYGILQPRVGISVHTSTTSRLARIYSGQTGFDIYSRAVSDVYQDLYGEGIFTGKGIYDVDALRAVFRSVFRAMLCLATISSKALTPAPGLPPILKSLTIIPLITAPITAANIAGCAATGRSSVGFSTRSRMKRRHLVPNPISLVSRWKIVDNLRRSLMEPATFLLFIAGWFYLAGRSALLDDRFLLALLSAYILPSACSR